PFRVGPHVYHSVSVAALKGYYYQRSDVALEPVYAGIWSRPAGHPDSRVLVHPSAAGPRRSAGTAVANPGGGDDAGDYNKYIVNCGITMGTLLAAYEDFSGYFDTLRTNIPPVAGAKGGWGTKAGAKDGGVPDILNEALYNLRWML